MEEKDSLQFPQGELKSFSSTVNEEDQKLIVQQRLSDSDRMELELSKMRRKLAIAEAEKALSESNRVELEYKYIVLQIYMKYSLTAHDAIDEQGNIIVGGAVSKQK